VIYRAAPLLCATFKGVLPSELYERYNVPGGHYKLEFDLLIASEIAEQLNEATASSGRGKKHRDAKGAVARRDRRRKQYVSPDAWAGMMKDGDD